MATGTIKITQDMVLRARDAGPAMLEGGYKVVRAMLEAALNPPPESPAPGECGVVVFGMPVIVDPNVPPNCIEIRHKDGRRERTMITP